MPSEHPNNAIAASHKMNVARIFFLALTDLEFHYKLLLFLSILNITLVHQNHNHVCSTIYKGYFYII